jgi:hypothetical protein
MPTLVMANNKDKTQKYIEITNRIEEHRKKRDLSALLAMDKEIEQKWRSTDVEMYARATLKLVQELGSNNLGQYNKQHGKAQKFAIKALEKADTFPLEVECEMLRYVQSDFDENGKKLKGESWKNLRKKRLKLWLHAWKRIEKTIDKNWNPNDIPVLKVSPPAAADLPSGASPHHIEDSQLRAEYEAAIEANRKKTETYNKQYKARQLKKYWLKDAQRSIIYSYMQPPAATDELGKLLKQYGIASEISKVLLDAVEKKEIPKHLKIGTTQPSK